MSTSVMTLIWLNTVLAIDKAFTSDQVNLCHNFGLISMLDFICIHTCCPVSLIVTVLSLNNGIRVQYGKCSPN